MLNIHFEGGVRDPGGVGGPIQKLSEMYSKIAIFGHFFSPSGMIAASSREKKVVSVLRG